MKFEPTKDKKEQLFQGFYLLFQCPTVRHQLEVSQMISVIMIDPEITEKDVHQQCARAIEAHENEKKLEATFNG